MGKLNRLKTTLRALIRERFNDVERSTEKAQELLMECQIRLQRDPLNGVLIEKEIKYSKDYHRWNMDRIKYL
ncbi:hypothetical protein RDI58_010629 [Solanum bulbocastanum]|uniref:Uncharacterized protein n=1 Tax=Solanum bulbocastanum TaxID=147425 RepID=A0AAN8YJN8_SOLBU